MARLYELWQESKAELHETKKQLQKAHAAGAAASEQDATISSMQSVLIELRDKCRFLELQLAGAREENGTLAQRAEQMGTALKQAQAHAQELQRANSKQAPMLHELQQVHRKPLLLLQLPQVLLRGPPRGIVAHDRLDQRLRSTRWRAVSCLANRRPS